jgi:fatty-acyl-CoA synthase
VEAVVTAHPSVSDAAVIGVPDATYVEVGCAVLTPTEGATVDLDGLAVFCRERLAAYKVPKHFVVVESLPRNGSGKVLKVALRESYRELGTEARPAVGVGTQVAE